MSLDRLPVSRIDGHARKALGVLLVIVAIGSILVQFLAVTRENVNWDEFALMDRAASCVQTGHLDGAGRPGLTTLTLIPFVQERRLSIDAVVSARNVWAAITLLLVAGLVVLFSQLRRRLDSQRTILGSSRSLLIPGVAAAFLVLVPIFQRWSLHVRSDQPALAFAIWGAVLLLASQRRLLLVLPAGAFFGVGYLFSQKALYVIALAFLLAGGVQFLLRDARVRRETWRAALCLAAYACVLMAFNAFVLVRFEGHVTSMKGAILGMYDLYGRTSYRAYTGMWPLLVAHAVVIVLLLATTARAVKRDRESLPRLAFTWAVICAGIAVMCVHASRHPYFWMTLGIFAAAAAALALEPVLAALAPRAPALVTLILMAMLLIWAVPGALERLEDHQSDQRRSLAFVERSFPPEARGFSPERALFHRHDPDPFPVYFSPLIRRAFKKPQTEAATRNFIADFRNPPVSFLVESYRLNQFPKAVQNFWHEAYVPYYYSIFVPGRLLEGGAGARLTFDAVVGGRFRLWWPNRPAGADERKPLARVDGNELRPDDVISLPVGQHEVEILDPVDGAFLALDLAEGPEKIGTPFYEKRVVQELTGKRRWWRTAAQ